MMAGMDERKRERRYAEMQTEEPSQKNSSFFFYLMLPCFVGITTNLILSSIIGSRVVQLLLHH